MIDINRRAGNNKLQPFIQQLPNRPSRLCWMQPYNFIFKQLTNNISPSSILTVLDILPAQIILEIRSDTAYQEQYHQQIARDNEKFKPKSKSKVSLKQYKIKFQNEKQFQQIIALIGLYDNRKVKATDENCRNMVSKLGNVHFGEVFVHKQSKKVCQLGLEKLEADYYRVTPALKMTQICKMFQLLHQNRKKSKKKMFQAQFNFTLQDNIMDIVDVMSKWISPCQCQNELQKLSLYLESALILSLEKNKQYGLSICLHRHSVNSKLCLAILEQFISYPIFVSLEFLDWEPSNNQAVNFVFANYHHRAKYLIKFGNYLEITELRLFINTTGMKKSEVASIFNLMKQPGHYELICHSTKQYFEEIANIFLYKPLIYFKYFVPLAQSQQLQSAIQVMMQKAQLLKKKVQVFMKMLKSPHKMDLGTIIKLFLTMSKTTPD